VKEILWYAQALAEFSNLEPNGVEHFRRKYPDFAPSRWWDYQSDVGKPQWQFNQGYLHKIWQKQFANNLHDRLLLTLSVFDPRDITWPFHDFDPEHMRGFDPDYFDPDASKPAFIGLQEMDAMHYYPYHKAALFLFDHPWRARFCVECKKRFVAAESRNIYCSNACFHERRNQQKLEWWNKGGKKQRAARQKRRGHARLPKGPK
jgi:hypothetical protein